jgi:hypothetical protein
LRRSAQCRSRPVFAQISRLQAHCLHAAENAGPLQGDHHLLHVVQQYVVAGEPRDVMAKRSFFETDVVTLFRAAMRRMTLVV